jgi:hypothetical protein
MQMTQEVWACCAIQAAVKLDLFTPLEKGELTVAELAAAVGGDARATGMLATALVGLGLLERQGQALRLPEDSRKLFSKNSPDYFGHMLRHQSHILPNWLRLDEAVKTGSRVAAASAAESDDDVQREAFLMAMYNAARMQADEVAEAMDLSGRKMLLDLGGGPGTYAASFCAKNPALEAAIFDLPASKSVAEKVVGQLGLSDRIRFIGGDFNVDPFPVGYDVVWLSQILHQESPTGAAALVAKAADALEKGGLLAVQEMTIADSLDGPVSSTLFSLNMLVNTKGGQSYTFREITDMMREASLVDVKILPLALPPGRSILFGLKP